MKQPVIITQTKDGFAMIPLDDPVDPTKLAMSDVSVATELDGYSSSALISILRAHFKEEPDVA